MPIQVVHCANIPPALQCMIHIKLQLLGLFTYICIIGSKTSNEQYVNSASTVEVLFGIRYPWHGLWKILSVPNPGEYPAVSIQLSDIVTQMPGL